MTYFFLLLFVFFVFWRPQDWLLPWMFGWNVLDAIMVLAGLSFLLELNTGSLKMPRKMPQLGLIVGIFVAAVMSHIANTYYAGMMETLEEVYKICIVIMLMFCVLDRPSRLRGVARVLVAMSCIMAIHALMQDRLGYGFAGARPMLVPVIKDNPAYTRSLFFGIFSDPNDLAQILATSIPFAFLIFRRRTLFSAIMGCGVIWLLVAGILTTHSRGGFVALTVVSVLIFVLVLPSRWLPFLMVVLVGTGLVLCPLSTPYLDMSAHERVMFWGYANQMFKQNFLFGIGYNMFWMIAEGRAAHNAFVMCYTELGFVGYYFWFGMLTLAFMGAWRTRMAFNWIIGDEQKYLYRFSGLGIAALGGFCASAYFLSRAFVYPMFFLSAMLGVLPVIAQDYLPEDRKFTPYTRRDVWLLCSVGTVISIIYIYYSIILLNMAWGG